MLARRHVIDGRERVVLHDEARGDHLELSVEAWAVIAAADGSRDLAGIVLAATRAGARATEASVRGLLEQLAARDALIEGVPEHAADVVTPRPRGPGVASLPVEALPEYRFSCHGRGGCCRAYGSILTTPHDRARAQAAMPDCAIRTVPPQRWFTPAKGSAPTPLAVPFAHEGGCGFLGDDGLCEIHRRAGVQAKPRACAAFPTIAASDGVSVRVSVTPECACVLDSAADVDGESLATGWAVGADLPETTVIDALPEAVAVGPGVEWTPAQVRTAVDAALPRVEREDPAHACWSLADVWAGRSNTPPSLAPYMALLRRRATDVLRRHAAWRPAGDWVLGCLRWLVGTLHLLEDDELAQGVLAQAAGDPVERLYVRASLWSYQGFTRRPVGAVLRRHAVKLWIARVMAEVPLAPAEDAVPLAVLSMLLRGHGLQRAWDQLDAPR